MTDKERLEAEEFAARLRNNHPEIMSIEIEEDDSGIYLFILLEPGTNIDLTSDCPPVWEPQIPIDSNRMDHRANFVIVNRIDKSDA